jgi:hypothetical protein
VSITLGNHATGASTNGANAITFSAGSLVVLCYALTTNTGSQSISSVTDTAGNVYSRATGAEIGNGSNLKTDIWYCANVLAMTGGTITTVKNNATNTGGAMDWFEFIGASTSNPLDGANAVYHVSGATTGNAITITDGGDALVAVSQRATTGNTGIDSPWTWDTLVAAYLIAPGIGTYTAAFQPHAADENMVSTAAFFQAGVSHRKGNMFLTF